MGAIAVFDYAAWIAAYPKFNPSVTELQATGYFAQATMYLRNDGTGPVCDIPQQTNLLYLLTAHIATLFATVNGVAPSPIVGRIKSATQGSESVDTDYGEQPPSAAWFLQTPYGAMYWQATAAYRTFRYRPNPRPVVNGAYPGYPPFGPYGWNNS